MAISYVDSAGATGGSATTIVVDCPTHQSGDILVAAWYYSSSATTRTYPDDWTQLAARLFDTSRHLTVSWKRAGGSEPETYTFTLGTATYHAISVASYRGCLASGDPTDGEPISNTVYVTNNTTIRAAGITLTQAATVIFCGGGSGATIDTWPSGFTGRITTHAAPYEYAAIGDKSLASGATGDIDATLTATSTRKHAMMIALVAAAAATGNPHYYYAQL